MHYPNVLLSILVCIVIPKSYALDLSQYYPNAIPASSYVIPMASGYGQRTYMSGQTSMYGQSSKNSGSLNNVCTGCGTKGAYMDQGNMGPQYGTGDGTSADGGFTNDDIIAMMKAMGKSGYGGNTGTGGYGGGGDGGYGNSGGDGGYGNSGGDGGYGNSGGDGGYGNSGGNGGYGNSGGDGGYGNSGGDGGYGNSGGNGGYGNSGGNGGYGNSGGDGGYGDGGNSNYRTTRPPRPTMATQPTSATQPVTSATTLRPTTEPSHGHKKIFPPIYKSHYYMMGDFIFPPRHDHNSHDGAPCPDGTPAPTVAPTVAPTQAPTAAPTQKPTQKPPKMDKYQMMQIAQFMKEYGFNNQ